jgi:ribosomal protein S18 acetylase RimI-like enzyme
VVDLEHRRRGIARALVDRCLAALKAEGIVKAHLDVFVTNSAAQRYWENRGWERRDDIYRYSIIDSESANA